MRMPAGCRRRACFMTPRRDDVVEDLINDEGDNDTQQGIGERGKRVPDSGAESTPRGPEWSKKPGFRRRDEARQSRQECNGQRIRTPVVRREVGDDGQQEDYDLTARKAFQMRLSSRPSGECHPRTPARSPGPGPRGRRHFRRARSTRSAGQTGTAQTARRWLPWSLRGFRCCPAGAELRQELAAELTHVKPAEVEHERPPTGKPGPRGSR